MALLDKGIASVGDWQCALMAARIYDLYYIDHDKALMYFKLADFLFTLEHGKESPRLRIFVKASSRKGRFKTLLGEYYQKFEHARGREARRRAWRAYTNILLQEHIYILTKAAELYYEKFGKQPTDVEALLTMQFRDFILPVPASMLRAFELYKLMFKHTSADRIKNVAMLEGGDDTYRAILGATRLADYIKGEVNGGRFYVDDKGRVTSTTTRRAQLQVNVNRINDAIGAFRTRHGRSPATLAALQDAWRREGKPDPVPPHPFGETYRYDPAEGKVSVRSRNRPSYREAPETP